MATYGTNEFKSGLKIMMGWRSLRHRRETKFVKPGKGQAFNRVKVRNLKTGRVIERTFRVGRQRRRRRRDRCGSAISVQRWRVLAFHGPAKLREQLTADAAAVGDAAKWLKEEAVCQVTLWNGVPLERGGAHRGHDHCGNRPRCAATPRAAAANRRLWIPARWCASAVRAERRGDQGGYPDRRVRVPGEGISGGPSVAASCWRPGADPAILRLRAELLARIRAFFAARGCWRWTRRRCRWRRSAIRIWPVSPRSIRDRGRATAGPCTCTPRRNSR